MLKLSSASVRSVNSERAMAECLDIAFPEGNVDECGLIVVNTSVGHSMEKLGIALKKLAPHITMAGSSCSGVIGREGVGESMNDIAIMAFCGSPEDYASVGVQDVTGANSYEKGLELATNLKAKLGGVHTIYLLCPGIDIANDLILKAFVETFGEEVNIFGGTSSDNMRGLVNFQYYNGVQSEHGAWAIGIADPGIHSITRATHGFSAYGQPLVATKVSGNKILEFNGKPAWQEYTKRLSLPPDSLCGATIPVGALAEKLPPELVKEYGNSHILRVITKYDTDGAVYYPLTCSEGLEVWLTTRDEDLIFSEQARALEYLTQQISGKTPCAVFQTDCLARGRFLFNKVMKDEIIAMMHGALGAHGEVPPWLGMYGFGEYAKLGGKNTYHNYSTSLLVLYR